MKRSGLTVFCLLLWLSLTGFAITFNPATMMRVRDIKPGMKGYGLTVFKGTKIEKFQVEILGVLPKDNITGDIILARLSGGPITERNAKVIAGMSGSPVYINGKLIGAVALTWRYSLEPLAGITPIENMIASANKEVPIGGALAAKISSSYLRGLGLRNLPKDDYITMVPIAVPLIASGFHPRALEKISSLFEQKGFLFMQAPAGGKMDVRAPLQPGAAIGCQLVSGDMQMTAIGTLTYIDENGEWLAFGHSMMDMGDAQMLAVSAYIHDVIPSIDFSTKLGSPGLPVGALTRDGYFAIYGKVGQSPRMIPVSISVNNGEKTQKFNVEVVRHPSLYDSLIASTVSNAVFLSCPDPVDVLAKVSVDIQLEGGKRISKSDVFYSSSGAELDPPFFVEDILYLLGNNVFQAVYPESVSVNVDIEKGRKWARLEKISIDKNIVKPGERVTITAYLREYGKEDLTTLPINLQIPPQAPEGRAAIYVGGGGYVTPQILGVKSPTNLSDMLDYLAQIPQNNQIITSLIMPGFRLQVGDKLLSPLPSGLEQMIVSSKETSLRRIPNAVISSIDTDWMVVGLQRLNITISKTGKAIMLPPQMGGPQMERGEIPSEEFASSEEEAFFYATKISHFFSSFSKVQRPQQGPSQQNQPPQPPSQQVAPESQPQPPVPPTPPSKPSQRIWIQSKYEDFSKGDISSSVVTRGGEVLLAPKWEKIATLPGSLLLSVIDMGEYYLATTLGKGAIYKVSPERVEELTRAKEIGLKLFSWQGKVFAYSFPGGNIYSFDLEKCALTQFASLPVDYIWDVLPKGDVLLVATGGNKGLLYSIDSQGKSTLLYVAPDQHILRIAEKGDSFLLGTAPQGLVLFYKDGEATSYSTGEQSVTALLSLGGVVYVGTAPGGKIFRIDEKGLSQLADTKEQGIYSLTESSGYLLAGTAVKGRIYLIDPSQLDRFGFSFEGESVSITGFVRAAKGLLALGSNPPTIYLSTSSFASQGAFTSSVFDGGITCNWGRLVIDADIPQGCKIEVETRSGNSPLPDAGWSAWTPLGIDGQILCPPARYLQYKVKMSTSDQSKTPILRRVTVYLLPQNLPPSLKIASPSWGDYLSGSADIKWTADDPNGDNLIATIYISENGVDWEKLGEIVGKNQYKLDTKGRKDGKYLLKVVVSDAGSNPPETALSVEKVVQVIIDNTPPKITMMKKEAKLVDGKLSLTGIAEDALSPIREVSYSLGGEVFYFATPLRGIFSSTLEPFSILVDVPPNVNQFSIKVKAKDSAGNETTVEEKITLGKEGKIERIEEVQPPQQKTTGQKQQAGKMEGKNESLPGPDSAASDAPDDDYSFEQTMKQVGF